MGNPKCQALQVGEKKLWLKSSIGTGEFGQMYIAECGEGNKEVFAVRLTKVPLDDRGRVTKPEVSSVSEEAGIVEVG